MSRATNLAGFVSAIYPSDNLNVGVITCLGINVTGFANISGINIESVGYATTAGIATYASTAGIATYASTAGIATYATTAGIATNATNATYATTAGIATYASTAGIATYASTAGIATNATNATYATTAGIATVAEGLTGSPDIIVGNITSSGDVSIAGTITYEDVTSVNSIGIITATSGIDVTGGIVSVVGQTNLANVNVSAAGTVATLNVTGQTSLANVSVSAASTFSEKINANAGVGFTGFLREGINIVNGKLSDNTTINIDHSMVHYFTTTETTTAIPNFTSTAGINTDLSVGETFSVNVITTAATAGYSTAARIDAGSILSVLWNGGTDPSEGGDGGVDLYTYQVIKTGDAAFTVLGNVSNFA